MNPRQRRGVVLLVLAALGAGAVFLSVLSFVGDVNAKVGDLTTVVEVTEDAGAFRPITPDMLTLREVPRRWLPEGALTDARDVVGLVSATDLPAGTYAQRGMFVPRPGVAPGFREVAILVDAETGVAGKIGSGDRVDILATNEGAQRTGRQAQVLIENALIIDVGVPEEVQVREESGFEQGKAVPVTFALPVQDALKVAFAESFAVKVRLALRGGGDQAKVAPQQQVFPAGAGR